MRRDGAEIVPRLVEECLRNLSGQLQLDGLLYPETVILAAIGAGGRHRRHADNCRQNEHGEWVDNHTREIGKLGLESIYAEENQRARTTVASRINRV
jgi:hypothetical protein